MKLNRVLCLFLMLAVVFTFASCGIFGNDEPTKYTVTFDSNGGSAVESQSVEEGKLAVKPADPTKDGYNFAGWYLGTDEWNFETSTVTSDVTLVAAWEKVEDPDPDPKPDPDPDPDPDPVVETYTITYMDGETALELTPNSIKSDAASMSLPTPEKAHYTFAGWYTEAELVNKVTAISGSIGADVTLYASFTAKTYNITYVLDGGVNADSNPVSYTIETLPAEFAAPTKDGYNFTGWYTDAGCTAAFAGVTADNAGNLTLFAGWEEEYVAPEVYNIYYLDADWNPIEGLEPTTYEVKDEDQYIFPTYEVDGYTFLGWKHAMTGMPVTCIPAGSTGDIRLQADLQQNVVTYTLTFVVDGEVFNTLTFDNAVGVPSLEIPSKAGYNFNGWYTMGGMAVDSIPAEIGSNVSVMGNWVAIEYAITYKDGDTVLELTPNKYTVADEVVLPAAPVKPDCLFEGWYDADGNKVTKIAAGSTGEVVLTAKYGELKFTVEYILDGGANDERNLSSFKPSEVPTLYAAESRDGFLFAGWFATVDFSGAAVESFADVIVDGEYSITLYAKWVPVSDDNGGGSTLTPEVPW